jgi:hypothetical protein
MVLVLAVCDCYQIWYPLFRGSYEAPVQYVVHQILARVLYR